MVTAGLVAWPVGDLWPFPAVYQISKTIHAESLKFGHMTGAPKGNWKIGWSDHQTDHLTSKWPLTLMVKNTSPPYWHPDLTFSWPVTFRVNIWPLTPNLTFDLLRSKLLPYLIGVNLTLGWPLTFRVNIWPLTPRIKIWPFMQNLSIGSVCQFLRTTVGGTWQMSDLWS